LTAAETSAVKTSTGNAARPKAGSQISRMISKPSGSGIARSSNSTSGGSRSTSPTTHDESVVDTTFS
jgi:hypothetical protein